MIERYEKFSFIISEIGKNLHKLSADEMKRFGMRGSWAKYLIALKLHTDGVTAGQLCDICDRNKADVSRAMSELESKGIVTRLEADANYRVRFLLTEQGKKISDALSERASIAIESVSCLDDNERRVLYKALESISVNLEMLVKNGIPTKE
jgi:DNA-binding MarR family transcriptional regulator